MVMRTKTGMLWLMLAVCAAIILTSCGGCTDSLNGITDKDLIVIPATIVPAPSTGQHVYGSLVIDVPDFVQHWKSDGTCYWEGRIHVTNKGDTPEMNVIIRSYLMRASDNEKAYVDSKTLQRIDPGKSLSYVSSLFGTCDTDYYIEVKVSAE